MGTRYMITLLLGSLCFLLLYGEVPGQTVVIPHGSPETIDYLENEDTERDMFNTINTGQIPNRLLQDILEEAKHFIHLFKTNPSRFLKRQNYMIKLQNLNAPMKKTDNYGIGIPMSKHTKVPRSGDNPEVAESFSKLSRPRFGKRSFQTYWDSD